MMPNQHTHPHSEPPADRRHRLAYTRAEAIADGLLIEVPTRLSRQFGFTLPLAVTAQAWFDAVAWDAEAEAAKPRPTGEHESGRIAELLFAARQATTSHPTSSNGHPLEFTVHRVPPVGRETRALSLTLKISHHTGDHGEPVATIEHANHTRAGAFRLACGDRLSSRWFAVGFDQPTTDDACPVVTPDTLDAVLAEATDILGIVTTAFPSGTVHVRHPAGHTVTLRTDGDGHYPLRNLGWPFIRVTS